MSSLVLRPSESFVSFERIEFVGGDRGESAECGSGGECGGGGERMVGGCEGREGAVGEGKRVMRVWEG